MRATEDAFGGLDVAFDNAGEFGPTGQIDEMSPEEWAADVTALLTSVFLPLRHEIPAMRRRGGGSVVNTASTLGAVGISGGISSYTAGKHGVIGLTKAAALEYAHANIRVNALALGTVDTPRYRAFVGDSQETLDMLDSLHPLGRIGTAEEAASAVVCLAGDEAAFFTGSVLAMDGGWTAR
ncbi:hypothetical protein GCM10009801_59450 [Streptomyces albiaxialis]|uniref:Short-chain dehydrogenase n=1 Tax=Streptomyces albiaxialis TaxID=329523 RepID=A0ABN2WHS7_9ACTN